MGPPNLEIEVKLRFATAEEALRRLETLGANLTAPRLFEDNVLYEREHASLKPQGKTLRLRRAGSRHILTYKGPAEEPEGPYKVRVEHETEVDNAEALRSLLDGLDFRPSYRYQKYRTEFEMDGLHICLDETPLGCFMELEGPPEKIDAAATRLGFEPRDYIRLSYRGLHLEAATARGEKPGDLLIEDSGGPTR